MTTYAVAYLTVQDPATFAAYRDRAGEALAKHGGRVAAVSPLPLRLEGSLDQPGAMALLAFEKAGAAEAWHADPELAELHNLRRRGADISIFVLNEGAEAPRA